MRVHGRRKESREVCIPQVKMEKNFEAEALGHSVTSDGRERGRPDVMV